MHEWAKYFLMFGAMWVPASALVAASADLKCYIDVLNATMTLEKLQSEYDDYQIYYNEEAESLNQQLHNLRSNRTTWEVQKQDLSKQNDKLNATLLNLQQTYNDTKLKLSKLEQSIEVTQRVIAINVNKRTNIAHTNEELTRSITSLMYDPFGQVFDQMISQTKLQSNTRNALITGLDNLNKCQQNVSTMFQAITNTAIDRQEVVSSTFLDKNVILNNEIKYSTLLRQYQGLEFCDGSDMSAITGTEVTPYMIKLCEILDLDEIQSCRAYVSAYEYNNTVATSQISQLEQSIYNKSSNMKKFNEETKSCTYDYGNCQAILNEKQMIVENRKVKEAEDTDESLNIYHALQAAMKIHSRDERFREMTRIMTKLDDRIIYKFEPESNTKHAHQQCYIHTLRTDLIQLYLMQSRNYLCGKLNCPCLAGHQCVLRPFYDMFLGQSGAFADLIQTTLKAVHGSDARFYAKTWSIGHFSIPPFLPFDDSNIFPPPDLTKGYTLLPQHDIFQSGLIDFLDPDVDLTRWLFKMNNAFGIPSPSPQERFFINVMNSTIGGIMNTPSLVEKYIKCKCISCDQVDHAQAESFFAFEVNI